jgi:N-methylhydantoinase B/oxoprolinase/acetone carboxylase alpha subunit
MLDPLTLEILWQRLITVADQMATTLTRTAFSNTITASNDLGCVIMDAEGNCIAHAHRSLPIFNQTMPYTTRLVLERFGSDQIKPGDVFISNDPWENAGHNPDITVITPFFKDETLVGFAATIAHHSDIGGALDINQVRDCYEEGLMIPLTRLYQAGELNQVVLDFLSANVRLPTILIGDIHAQSAANQTGADRCLALLEEYELPNLLELSAEIQDRSEAAMRTAICAIPNGEYHSQVTVDELDRPLLINCTMRVEGDELWVDFEGTSPQQPRGGINVTFTFASGQVSYALKTILLSEVPGNSGCYRPIHVSAPPGCVLNAQRPASVSQRHRVGAHIFGAVMRALSEVMAEQIIAGSGFLVSAGVFARPHDSDEIYHTYCFSAGGMGANANTSGISTIQVPALAANVPVELFEIAVPLLTVRREFITDSGGAGMHRGGLSQRVEFQLLTGFNGAATVSIWAAGQNIPPFGLLGGYGGTPAEIRRNGHVLSREEKLAQAGALQLEDTDTVVGFDTAGGGGYGPPSERDPELIKQDVRDGLVSPTQAEAAYGVAIRADTAQTKHQD